MKTLPESTGMWNPSLCSNCKNFKSLQIEACSQFQGTRGTDWLNTERYINRVNKILTSKQPKYFGCNPPFGI